MDREWFISLGLKYMLILLLPFYFIIGPKPAYYCILFQIGEGSMPILSRTPHILPLIALWVLTFTLPALSFDYIQHKRPKHRSVGRVFLVAFLLSSPVIQSLILGMVGLPILARLGFSFLFTYPLADSIDFGLLASQWAPAVMVVIPYLIRQLNGLEHPKQSNDSGIISTIKGMISRMFHRNILVPIILGFSVLLMPTLFILDLTDPFGRLKSFGLNSQYWLLLSGSCVIERVPLRALGLVFSLMPYVINASIMFSVLLYMVFAKHVLGYLVGNVSRRRCVVSGTAATLATPLVLYIPLPWMAAIEYVAYPLPFILILGLVIVWRFQPVQVKETPWEVKAVPVEREVSDVTTLPLISTIRSKLRRSSAHPAPSNWETPKDEVFADSLPLNESDSSQ